MFAWGRTLGVESEGVESEGVESEVRVTQRPCHKVESTFMANLTNLV